MEGDGRIPIATLMDARCPFHRASSGVLSQTSGKRVREKAWQIVCLVDKWTEVEIGMAMSALQGLLVSDWSC